MPSAAVHGSKARLLLSGWDVSPSMRNGGMPTSVDVADSSTWGMASKRYTSSDRVDGSFTGDGVWESLVAGAGGIDELLGGPPTTIHVASYMPQGDSFGARARAIGGIESAFELTSPGDDVTGFSFELMPTLGLTPRARVLVPLAGALNISVGGNSAGLDDTGAAPQPITSTKGLGAALHVINKGGGAGTITVKVQHAPDNSTWTDLITFGGKAAKNLSEYAETAANVTVQRWLRALWTLTGGTWDIHVVAGRK